MQSKGKRGKILFFVLLALIAAVFVVAMFREPTFEQTTIEQVLDAAKFEQ